MGSTYHWFPCKICLRCEIWGKIATQLNSITPSSYICPCNFSAFKSHLDQRGDPRGERQVISPLTLVISSCMFNLPMKQVHNLLRSTYCHWPGPAITWNCCFSNQVIWAMTLGGRGRWDGQEEKALGVSCVGVVFFTTAMLRHLGADHSTRSWFSQAAVRRCTPILRSCHMHCKMTMALLSHHKHKLFFLPRRPRRSVQVSPETVHQRPWNCLLPPLCCSLLPWQGRLLRKAQPITFGIVQRSHWPGRDLVATLSEIPMQCSLSKKDLVERQKEGNGGGDELQRELAGGKL